MDDLAAEIGGKIGESRADSGETKVCESVHTNRGRRSRRPRAFTLIEILVVISIIALLVAIVLPQLRMAREQGKVAYCLANVRTLMQGTGMYVDDHDSPVIPWYTYPALPGYGVNNVTPFVFGGFTARSPSQGNVNADYALYPAEARPLNRYLAPNEVGKLVKLKHHICLSDKGSEAGPIGPTPGTPSSPDPDWATLGTSYSLNARFMSGYSQPSGSYGLMEAGGYAERIARQLVGGRAARVIMWSEVPFYRLGYGARPDLSGSTAGPQRAGWHLEFSKWVVAFADGHARYGYFDTRLSIGPEGDWTIWEPK